MISSFRISIIFLFLLVFSTAQSQILYWGLTNKGGQNNAGTIFYTDRDGNEQYNVHSFEYGEGDSPIGSLIFASDEKLYGTTPGGNIDYGVIFQFDDNLFQYQKMFEFNGGTDGFQPTGHLINHSSGKIYGMTRNGGEDLAGLIFEYIPGESEINVKKTFSGNDGAYPEGGLAEGPNQLLYGLTSYGGDYDVGVLFVFDPETDDYEKLFDFSPSDGMTPVCNLLMASNGKLYGVAPKGGIYNLGVLFEYDIISETFTKLVDFNNDNAGSEPVGSLMEASNSLLYGMAMKNEIEGNNYFGTIYAYDITNYQIHKLYEFDGENGSSPTGSLIEAENNLLIGVTDKGGTTDGGVRFEFDISDNSYVKKEDFNGENGSQPVYASLLKVYYMGVDEEQLHNSISIIPNPATTYIQLSLSDEVKVFQYTIINLEGKVIDRRLIEGNQIKIDTRSFKTGAYLLQIKSNGITVSKKVLIK